MISKIISIKILGIFLLGFSSIYISAQNFNANRKGTFSILWGWNSEYYSDSNIHFWGTDYDFKLKGVRAKQKFIPFAVDPHLTLDKITIPQTNLQIGYFIKDNLQLSLNMDHMKYVMVQDQTAQITGKISHGTAYDGTYDNEDIVLTEDFLTFEHTDGLNYGNIELSYFTDFNPYFRIRNYKAIQLSGYVGAGAGLVVPKTNAKIFSEERHDEFHIAGFGLSSKLGLNISLFKYLLLKYEWKMGYINMPDIRTTYNTSDKAAQSFFFSENFFAFGFQVHF